MTRFQNGEMPLLAAQTITRGLEVCAKCWMLTEESEQLSQKLLPLQNHFVGVFPIYDYASLRTRIESLRRSLILGYGPLGEALSARSWVNQDWPDYLGTGYVSLMEECVNSLLDSNGDDFSELWMAFLKIHNAIQQQERPKAKVAKEWDFLFSTEPLFDLISMSGFAISIAELRQDPSKSSVILNFWNLQMGRFADASSQHDYAESIAALVRMHNHPWRQSSRHVIRSQWKRQLEQAILDSGLVSDSIFNSWERRLPKSPPHESPLINAILANTTDFGMYADLADVFVVDFLVRECDFQHLPLTPEGQSLANHLERGWSDSNMDDGQ
jgi:hypothetical protein